MFKYKCYNKANAVIGVRIKYGIALYYTWDLVGASFGKHFGQPKPFGVV